MSEKEMLTKWANSLSDEEVKSEYQNGIKNVVQDQDSVFDSIHISIKDKYIADKLDVLAKVCLERNISIWE